MAGCYRRGRLGDPFFFEGRDRALSITNINATASVLEHLSLEAPAFDSSKWSKTITIGSEWPMPVRGGTLYDTFETYPPESAGIRILINTIINR